MVQGYYTLEEAAQILGMEADQLSHMAQRREIRAFADRGTWRFRTQDVEELGRRMGIGSDPELQPGEGPKSSGKLKAPKKPPAQDDFFEFELSGSSDEMSVELDDPGAVRKKTNLAGTGTGKEKKPASGDDAGDAPIGFLDEAGPTSGRSKSSGRLKGGATGKIKPDDADSGLRLVPSGDEELPLPDFTAGKPDSDVKLNPGAVNLGGGLELPPTEEVVLDDLKTPPRKSDPPTKKASSGKLASGPKPETSPFELSEADLNLENAETKKMPKGISSKKIPPAPPPPADDDEVSLGDLTIGEGDFSGTSGASGINLHVPADTGVNLERSAKSGEDDVEFELSLDGDAEGDLVAGPSTAKGLKKPTTEDSDESDFELSLGDDGLTPLKEESSDSTEVGEEKDIFETDFEIPALEDESGSEVAAVEEGDTDLESSDFEFDPSAAEEELESGSQVVALDDAESGSQVVAVDEEDEEGARDEEEDELVGITETEEEEEEDEEAVGAVARAPAPWGPLPLVFMLPCVAVMGLLALMTFEMLHGLWGYRQPQKPATWLLKPAADLFGAESPKD